MNVLKLGLIFFIVVSMPHIFEIKEAQHMFGASLTGLIAILIYQHNKNKKHDQI